MAAPVGTPFSRVLLYGVVAATLTTVWVPLLFSTAQKHPCRKAHHGWRAGCRGQGGPAVEAAVEGWLVDWAATVINVGGLALG